MTIQVLESVLIWPCASHDEENLKWSMVAALFQVFVEMAVSEELLG